MQPSSALKEGVSLNEVFALSKPQLARFQRYGLDDDEDWTHRFVERVAEVSAGNQGKPPWVQPAVNTWDVVSQSVTGASSTGCPCCFSGDYSEESGWHRRGSVQCSSQSTASSRPSRTPRSMQEWWAWIPSVDNWGCECLRGRRPPIRVRSPPLSPPPPRLISLSLPNLKLPLPFIWHKSVYFLKLFPPPPKRGDSWVCVYQDIIVFLVLAIMSDKLVVGGQTGSINLAVSAFDFSL